MVQFPVAARVEPVTAAGPAGGFASPMCARVGVLRVLGMVVGQVASRVRKSHGVMSVTPIARRGVSWEFLRADAAVATASPVQANAGPEGKLRRRVQASDVPRPATTAVAV